MPPLTASLPLRPTAAALRCGSLPLRQHIDAQCDRLQALEPAIRALLPEPERRRRLHREAEALLQRYPDPEARPPLFGVLVGLKDIFRADGFPTRAGSALPPELFGGPEAASVARLRRAGALVLGKTVTTEFAYFDPGPTANPHETAHTPGGSSSGSAAAVAAGYGPLALGSQTVGSVIRPAAFCGVVGFKPTYARIPIDGVLPFSASVDHVGLFTQDAAGAALAASLLCDGWQPPLAEAAAGRLPVLAVPDGPYLDQAAPEGRRAFDDHVARLESRGCVVHRLPALSDIAEVTQRHRNLVAAEFAAVHDAWFRDYGSLYRPHSAMLIERGRAVAGADLAAARAGRAQLRSQLQASMEERGVDLWICPAAPGPAPAGLGATGDPALNLPWTHAGLPALTLPAGATAGAAAGGLPLGLQIVGRFRADEALLAWAQLLEPLLAPGQAHP